MKICNLAFWYVLSGLVVSNLFRFMLNMTISDQTGKQWVTVFHDQAVPLLGNKTADELYQLKEGGQVR